MINLEAIGTIRTPYKEKFAVPRQPSLVRHAKGFIELHAPYDDINCLRGIEQFSHLWLSFVFHQNLDQGWRPLVRPPRLGGNEKVGVFASRSTFRPNGLGMSVVKLEQVSTRNGNPVVVVSGMDLVDGTPIVDIRPYLPYADAVTDASGGFADNAPQSGLTTEFADSLIQTVAHICRAIPEFKDVVVDVLNLDPRPAYKTGEDTERVYGVHLYHYNIRWVVRRATNHVVAIERAEDGSE